MSSPTIRGVSVFCLSCSLVGGCRDVGFGLRVDGCTCVGDISDITVVVVSGVGYSLDATIRKSNGV